MNTEPYGGKNSIPEIDASTLQTLEQRFIGREATIGIIGLGYVGLPLAVAALTKKINVFGFDVDQNKTEYLNRGKSYIRHISDEEIGRHVIDRRFLATTDYSNIRMVDSIIICVPTPLTKHREPDLHFIENTARAICPYLRRGHLVVLESTTWPGTTAEILTHILECSGLKCGKHFFVAFSPEREDPGNPSFSTIEIPKVVGADDPASLTLAIAMYTSFINRVVTVKSTKTAEAVKLTENIFRAVNIALVNELKTIYSKMGIDIWEVIEAAKSKPFGYMPFYPGPGLGGHCIPIDPFYLTWKAREYGVSTRFVELAGEINISMPHYVVDRLADVLNERTGKGLRGANILVSGVAYKKNVDDIRESPAFKIFMLLEAKGATFDFYDPFVPRIPETREHPEYAGRQGIKWDLGQLRAYDAILIITDHDSVDYAALCAHSKIVVDTRNACQRFGVSGVHSLVKA